MVKKTPPPRGMVGGGGGGEILASCTTSTLCGNLNWVKDSRDERKQQSIISYACDISNNGCILKSYFELAYNRLQNENDRN